MCWWNMLLHMMKQFRRITWKTFVLLPGSWNPSNSPSSSLIQKSVWYICIGLSQYSCRLSYNTLEGLCFALVLFFLFSWIFVCSNTEYEHSLYPHDQCWGILLISSFYQWLLWFQIVFKSKSWGGKFSLDTCETLDKWMSFDILFIHYL